MNQRVACLHADVSGYCRLISTDIASAVRTLTAYRAVMIHTVARHGGRVVDTAGDSLFATFLEAAAAVGCAVEIQKKLETRNAVLPTSRRMTFRIGIDLGTVLVDEGRVYGDCVNIAARVQQIAPDGSICIAGTAYDDIERPLALQFEYLGERALRSIDKTQRLYRVE